MSELDPLDTFMRDAAGAARDRASDGVDDGAATRLRIRESMTRPVPRRRFTIIAAVLATMFGSTAFAYVAAVKAGWVASPFHHDDPAPVIAPAPPPEKLAAPSKRLPEVPSADVIGSTTMEAPTATVVDANLGVAATDQSAPVEIPAPPAVVIAQAPVVTKPPIVAKAPVVVSPRVEQAPQVEQAPRPDLVKAPRPAITAEVPNPPAPVEKAPEPQQIAKEAPKVEVAPNGELAAYRHAHELHFRGGDAKAALIAWDDYLKTYPSGSLAPDARYDRAILLVKMGRYADARTALAPFAKAAVGSYRQKEAAEILAAIANR